VAVNGRVVRADVENSGMIVSGTPMESGKGSLAAVPGFGSRMRDECMYMAKRAEQGVARPTRIDLPSK
jgi:hypothetical protein